MFRQAVCDNARLDRSRSTRLNQVCIIHRAGQSLSARDDSTLSNLFFLDVMGGNKMAHFYVT